MDFGWNCVEYVDASAAVDAGAAELVAAEGEGADHATGMSSCGSLEVCANTHCRSTAETIRPASVIGGWPRMACLKMLRWTHFHSNACRTWLVLPLFPLVRAIA